jgi:hypothetical protein
MTQSTNPDESRVLLASLNAQHRHVLWILEGLSEESLRRTVLPSGWTCAGLVQHLALDVERFWFRIVVAGESVEPGGSVAPADAWHVSPGVSGAAVLALYRQEIERANELIAARSLDTSPEWWPVELWPDWRFHTLREVILHVITETACHAGHLDAARELIDGRTWMVLTD